MGEFGEQREIRRPEQRIREAFHVKHPGAPLERRTHRVRIHAVDKPGRDSIAGEKIPEKRVGSAIDEAVRDDDGALFADREECGRNRCHARCGRVGGRRAFKTRECLAEHTGRWTFKTGVEMASGYGLVKDGLELFRIKKGECGTIRDGGVDFAELAPNLVILDATGRARFAGVVFGMHKICLGKRLHSSRAPTSPETGGTPGGTSGRSSQWRKRRSRMSPGAAAIPQTTKKSGQPRPRAR